MAGYMSPPPFADLQAELDTLPDVAIVAVGGLPVRRVGDQYELFGAALTPDSLRTELRRGLGLGAVLTYRNPKNKSLDELAELCVDNEHFWTAHVLSLTLVFARCPLTVRNAFAFDRRFHLSWTEAEVRTEFCTFTATGSAREWTRFIAYAQNSSFNADQRAWFAKAGKIVTPIL